MSDTLKQGHFLDSQCYTYEPSGIQTCQNWLYATRDSQYMGNFKQTETLLFTSRDVKLATVMLSKFLTTLLTSIEDIFELFFLEDLCLISQELKTSHSFQFCITSSPRSVFTQKPTHLHLCTTSSCMKKPKHSEYLLIKLLSKEKRIHLPKPVLQAIQNWDQHKNYQWTEYKLDDQKFL